MPIKNKKYLFLIFTILFIFQGCSFISPTKEYTYINQNKRFPYKLNYNYEVTNKISYSQIYNALKLQYKEWKGIKYKYGGTTKRGIDCSAFVQNTFKNKLHIKIPRTTILQAKIGATIKMQNLEIGDLIFFKTSYKYRHVGIYLGEGKFMHASTKKGITISRLDNPYYKRHFWKIQRVIF